MGYWNALSHLACPRKERAVRGNLGPMVGAVRGLADVFEELSDGVPYRDTGPFTLTKSNNG